jgi:hypothetical protein
MPKLRPALTSLSLVLAQALPMIGQQPASGSWQRLTAVAPQSRVDLRTDHGRSHCRVVRVTEQELVCSDRSYSQAEIREARWVRHGRSTGQGALIGLGVGAGVGLGVGAVLGSKTFGLTGRGAAVGVAIFAPLGALVGALAGRAGDSSSEIVYRR